jgi:hypothetical protein
VESGSRNTEKYGCLTMVKFLPEYAFSVAANQIAWLLLLLQSGTTVNPHWLAL